MKKILFLLSLAATIAFFAACRTTSTDNLAPEDALKVLDAKIKKDSDNADLYYQRAKVLIDLGKEKQLSQYFRDAISDLEKATSIDDTKIDYFTALGDAYFSLGDAGNSYSALQKALKIDENNFEACLKMGEIAFYSKDYDRAMESLSKVTQQEPNNQTALFMKGFIYKETGDTANAVHYFRQLTELYPDYEPAYEVLGVLYADAGNRLGVEYLNTALSLQPENINVLYALARFYQDAEDPDKATEYYVRILEINPKYTYAWFNRGWMEMVLYEDYNAAIDFFNKAIECDPNYGQAYYNIGYIYQIEGDAAKAASYFEKAKQLGYDENKN